MLPNPSLPVAVAVYSEMKVASVKTAPSSTNSWSPILSLRDNFVFCGEY